MHILREYQQKIVDKVITSESDLLVCLPTGSGKTVIAAALIERFSEKNKIVVFVVPRLELIEQASEEFPECDIIWSDKTRLTGKNCIIASKDSLRTQAKLVPKDVIIIIDEAHISLEQSFKLVKKIKPQRVIGLTATPERMDGLALLKGTDKIHQFGIFDELQQEESVVSLQKKGFLSDLKYYTKPIEGITEIKSDAANGEELSENQIREIFEENNIWGDIVATYEKYGIDSKGNRRPALGFTNTIALAEQVCKLFNENNYKFKVISGEMSIKQRKELINELRTKKIDGLVNASLLTYGFDCPDVSYAFSCRHIKSRPLWFQIVGRILRICENKEDAIFIDHGDSISEFEEPDCSLPILSSEIKWRVDGEDKVERQLRKAAQKKERESLKFIQELVPLPCDMVEIKPENTWERLLEALKKLKKENVSLQTENNNLSKKIIDLQNRKPEAKIVKPSSKNTFEFCKNYGRLRQSIHEKVCNEYVLHPSAKLPDDLRILEHHLTETELKTIADKQHIALNEYEFERSMNYWKNNWKYWG